MMLTMSKERVALYSLARSIISLNVAISNLDYLRQRPELPNIKSKFAEAIETHLKDSMDRIDEFMKTMEEK